MIQIDRSRPNVAVIGCGRWGTHIARTFAELGALSAISSRHTDSLKTLADDLGVASRSVDDVLADPMITAVAIAAPAQAHVDLAKAAMSANKAVWIEKPAALNREGINELIAAKRQHGVQVMVGHVMRYDPAVEALHDIALRGDLGDLIRVEGIRTAPGRLRTDETVLMGFGPHALSIILPLIGFDRSSELRVVSRSVQAIVTPSEPHANHVDAAHITLASHNTLQLSVNLSWMHPQRRRQTIVIGTKAMAVLDELSPLGKRLAIFDYAIKNCDHHPDSRLVMDAPYYIKTDGEPPLTRQCREFIRCLQTGDKPRTGLAEAKIGLDILWSK